MHAFGLKSVFISLFEFVEDVVFCPVGTSPESVMVDSSTDKEPSNAEDGTFNYQFRCHFASRSLV